MKFDLTNPRTLATTAIMTALVLGLTLIHVAPTPIGGYIHLGDIAINFAALAFGPWVGLIAGGVGAALSDILSGYAVFSPITLVVHGLQGLLVGWIYWRKRSTGAMAAGLAAGTITVVLGYFIGETLFYASASGVTTSSAQALVEVPWNIVQELVGLLGAVVFVAVARAYPRLTRAE